MPKTMFDDLVLWTSSQAKMTGTDAAMFLERKLSPSQIAVLKNGVPNKKNSFYRDRQREIMTKLAY